ncbi:rhodanese-like domain-containing protein [Cohaesibacter gelatinilyticus]|uniref:Rhodanese-related sulfurtransferase n=1 Tax=Cohaesibacter gelatinilyticus TaxID=372072 RepID=A0A285PFF3_9HYPH|nr:rhodanese-like domain-containing protein [Cohaesibacter gelatinilyticus]SNZ20033.1 Rhodanese-related sulfurtransferase [Cohaesibacter gelatinilyticus]HAT85930.1 sulfurtransferase [Hyphomicrobiales bacterium]
MSNTGFDCYAGDICTQEAWQILEHNNKAVLIDVRTHAEWSFVGVPDLTGLGKSVLQLEWLSYPAMQVHADFGERLLEMLSEHGADQQAPLLFLCRSGVRSRNAAIVMTKDWSGPCYNVAGGFEGDLDAGGHRATVSGWKKDDLPWRQF